MLKPILLSALLAISSAQAFELAGPQGAARIIHADSPTMKLAAELLGRDVRSISGQNAPLSTQLNDCGQRCIIIGTYDSPLVQQLASAENLDLSPLKGNWERYDRITITSRHNPGQQILLIAGADPRGAIYGVIDLTREIGVSAWEWWADVAPAKRATITTTGERITSPSPSVKYRGIFLNDEDWGLQPWAAKTYDPAGDIGPTTYARIYELLWRLKANLIWPAMHDSTKPFYQIPGNAEKARDYAIVVGTSHAEPMMRNNVREWNRKQDGEFNFFSNRDALVRYWDRRVNEVKGFENMYSVGIRGVHDSAMEGADTIDKAREGLTAAIAVQRKLLAEAQGKPAHQIPQALTLYKEVLDLYKAGLQVPDDITLIWPDDNYGYLHQLSTPDEARRSGGTGLYYHISYWGRPHDYLWLGTTHPALIREQLERAVGTGANRTWVVNVGDIKPLEYLTQYFLDIAFDNQQLRSTPREHLVKWAVAQFGGAQAEEIADILTGYYDLAWERRPEFMGFSQTEPTTQTRQTDYLQYGTEEAEQRLAKYNALVQRAQVVSAALPAAQHDSFFQLVLYPVRASANLNSRILKNELAAQYARSGRPSAQLYACQAEQAQRDIVSDTAHYNDHNGGKWRGMMDAAPRRLPVFIPPLFPQYGTQAGCGLADQANLTTGRAESRTLPLPTEKDRIIALPAATAGTNAGWTRLPGLGSYGASMRADLHMASIAPGAAKDGLAYEFTSHSKTSAQLKFVAIPVHPLTSANKLRIAYHLDDGPLQTLDFETFGRSDEWKLNTLSNTAVRTASLRGLTPGRHRLTVYALDPGFILDRIEVAFDGAPRFYGKPLVRK